MPYNLLADLVLLLHLTFILFVVFGGLLVLWRSGLAWVHLPCAFWGMLIEFKGWICPLTYLENDLRSAAGSDTYSGGFIENYLVPLVYPPSLTPEIQTLLGLLVLFINLIIYTIIWHRKRVRQY